MAEVTLLGAGGATITIALSSTPVAEAAQLAVNKVNALTAQGLVDIQTINLQTAESDFGIEGSRISRGGLPYLKNRLGGAVFTDSGFNGSSGGQYLLLAANGIGTTEVSSGRNANTVVVAGDGSDLTYRNQSANAQVFFGRNNGVIENYGGYVTATTSDGTYVVVGANRTDEDQPARSTTMNLGVGGTVNVLDVRGPSTTTVTALGNGTINALSAHSLPGLVNITLASGDVSIGLVGMDAVINPGAARATIIGSANAAATLFGGTGSLTVGGVAGHYTGGSAGGNAMLSSAVSGSTTLVDGGAAGAPGDGLIAQGAGQMLFAGSGNTTLAAVTALGATGGSTFNVGDGISTVFGFEGGGSTISFGGDGISQVLGRNGALAGLGNIYNDVGSGAGRVSIHDFITGLDTLTVKNAFSITFFALDDPGNATGSEVTLLQIVGGGSYTFFDATPDGVANIFASDVTKIG